MVTCFFTTPHPGGEVYHLRFMVQCLSQNDGACTHTHTQDLTQMLHVFSVHEPMLQNMQSFHFPQEESQKI